MSEIPINLNEETTEIGIESVPEAPVMVSDYNELTNKPKINNVELSGNKTGSQLGLVNAVEGKGLSSNDYSNEDKAKVQTAVQPNAISDMATKTWVEAKNYITNAVNNLLNYFTKTEVNTLLGGKVDKVEGKGLSKNDFTDTLKTKLDGIENGATKVEKTSDIENDSGFITNLVNDLQNYYLKSSTYNKNEVDTLINAIKQFTYEVASVLPTPSASTMNKIYLVPSSSSQTQNVKDEYITLENSGVYSWEQIGSTSIDLSNYYTKSQTDDLLDAKQDVISDLSTIRSGASLGATALQSVPNTYRTSADQDLIDASKENTSNKVTSLSSSSTDTQYPSAKVTYDELKARIETIALTDGSETLAQLKSRIDAINTAGRHVFFDTSSLNASMYLCTIYIDGTSKYRITDAVTGKTSIGDYDASKTLLTILNEAIADLVTITVTCTTQDGVTVTGQTVTLRNGTSAEAPVLATKSYNGQPVTFVVSKDTVYYVSVSDTLAEHFNPTTAQGVAVNNVSAILTYSDIHHVNTWAEIQQVVQTGFGAQAFPVGTTFNINVDGLGSTVWTVMHHITGGVSGAISLKNNKQYGMILQSRDCLYNGLFPFDDREAFYSNETQMSAGTYNFKLGEHTWRSADVGKYYEFTTTEDIPANAQFVFQQGNSSPLEGASVKVFANGLSTVEITSFTLTEGQTGTYLGELKNSFSSNFNSCQRAFYGNNRWKESFERQFLNSNLSNSWWEAKNKWDRSHSYQANSGFMYRLPSDFKAVLGQVDIDTVLNNVCDGGGKETTTDTIFLPTRSECYGGAENAYDNGVAWQQYINAIGTDTPTTGATAGRVKVSIGTSTARWWWWRDPSTGYANGTRDAYVTGGVYDDHASYSRATAPACVIC